MRYAEKCGRAEQATDDNTIWRIIRELEVSRR
jgi:hypothetical protein